MTSIFANNTESKFSEGEMAGGGVGLAERAACTRLGDYSEQTALPSGTLCGRGGEAFPRRLKLNDLTKLVT